jgi:F-type H+-transporting ATPase subunit b
MGSINGTSRFRIAVALFSMLMVTPMVRAQAQRQPEPSTPNAIEMNSQPPSDTKNIVQDVNSGADPSSSAARPSESGDPDAQFKNSASLKWMARKLGVRTATAYELSVVVNFLVIIAAGFLLLRSRLPALFRNRTQVIRQALDEARKASAEAQQRLSAIEGRLAKLQSEISALQSAADQESRAEEERIRAAAEEEKRKIVQGAEQEIAVAVSLAKRDFEAYAADLAVTLAANSIQVDAPTDEALLRAFVDQLGPNGSN